MKHGADRKITKEEFFILVNKAYEFLKVKMDLGLAESVFNEADKDKDGLITYVEYFQFIEKCVCQTKEGNSKFIFRVCTISKIS